MRRLVAALLLLAACGGSATADRPAAQVPPSICTLTGHYCVTEARSWTSIATELGVTADALQLANYVSAGTSNSATVPAGRVLQYMPPPAPPTTTTTLPPAPTTTTSPPTTSTAPSTTSTTGPSTSTSTPATTTTTSSPATTSTTSSPSSTSSTVPSGGTFFEGFDAASSLDRFDWQISHGGVDPYPRNDQPASWQADHDMGCAPPPSLRNVQLVGAAGPGAITEVDSHGRPISGLAFWCAPGDDPARGHLMTSTTLTAYGHIDFSPRQVFTNVQRVCWSMNRSELGGGKWAQVSIIPLGAFNANEGALDYVKPALENDVAAAGPVLPVGAFQLETFRSAVLFAVGDGARSQNDLNAQSLDAFGTPASDRATRYQHCLVDTPGGAYLQIGNDDPIYQRRLVNGQWVNDTRFRFPTGPVRVIFQDVTYDSLKRDFSHAEALRTNTWHWDDIRIEVAS